MAQPQPYWATCPQPGMGRDTKLSLDVNSYGDGYTHRSTRGLNPVRPTWSLTFPFVGLDALKGMDDFLRANAMAGFWFTPPDAVDPVFVTVDDWASTIVDRNLDEGVVGTLQARFAAAFNPQPIAVKADAGLASSVDKSLSWMRLMGATRTTYHSSVLTPDDYTADRHSTGPWTGVWTLPLSASSAPYSPVLLQGPLYFPLSAGLRADFSGRVDVPFYSMDGWAGRRDMANPTPPPATITDPSTAYADGGVNFGRYFVLGSCSGAKQFIAPVAANATWSASVDPIPPGPWEFQIITYPNQAAADGDVNRVLVGAAWREVDRPGDVRGYYTLGYAPGSPQFVGVVLSNDGGGYHINGSLQTWAATAGLTYQILVTNETDVEYAWALEPVSEGGAFTVTRPQAFGGMVKLRLVEQQFGCTTRVVGQVWAQENAADVAAYPDLRVEYRDITDLIGPFPTSSQPAQLNRTWAATRASDGPVGRVSLVNVNTKRIYGEYTMPTGLMRSFIVPSNGAGQDTTSVYYDGFLDACFLYDQAVALIAFLQLGETALAHALVDALLAVQNADGSFSFSSGQSTLADRSGQDFIRIGAVAWVCYALLIADSPPFRSLFPGMPVGDAARQCLNFMLGYTNDIGTVNGGKGQYVDGVLDPAFVVPWWSVEHNLDVWWCLDQANTNYGTSPVDWSQPRDVIAAALRTAGYGWDTSKGIFWQGGTVSLSTGSNTPDGMHALDTHSWGAALLQKLGQNGDASVSLARASSLYYVTDVPSGLSGYTTFIAIDGYPAETIKTPWYEGSFGVVAALRYHDADQANTLMSQLVKAQRADGSYLYALQNDPINDIHNWPCLIASAWNVLAYSGPGTPTTQRVLWPIP